VLHSLLVGAKSVGAELCGLRRKRWIPDQVRDDGFYFYCLRQISNQVACRSSRLMVIVLVVAPPSISNVSLQAGRFGANNGRIARIILLSTVLALFSFSAAVALLT
jgi:hypothetical protein